MEAVRFLEESMPGSLYYFIKRDKVFVILCLFLEITEMSSLKLSQNVLPEVEINAGKWQLKSLSLAKLEARSLL